MNDFLETGIPYNKVFFPVIIMFHFFIEIVVLVTALSVDSFAASFAYGVNRVRIPFTSMLILASISCGTLAVSMLAGKALSGIIPASLTTFISFAILLVLGLIKLFDRSCCKEADKADKNNDHLLAPSEALSLGVALSLDSMAAGIGAGMDLTHLIAAIIAAFLMGIASILLGSNLGKIVSNHFQCNICWVSGVLLIALAFMKFF